MERDGNSRAEAERVVLDAIRDLKEIGVDPGVAQQLEAVERSLRSASGADANNEAPRRRAGAFAGLFKIGPEFFEPLSDEELRAWGEK